MTNASPTEGSTRPLAVVTGASTGIGLELARELAGRGYDLVVAAGSERLETAADELESLGAQVRAVRADLASTDGVEQLYAAVTATGRPVDVAALNAGVGANGRFDQIDLDDDLRLVALNVTSSVHLAKLLVRDMVGRGRGRLLFTSSVAATMPGPYYATYAASKAFLQSFAQALRAELSGTGVTVTALMPGPTATDFFRRARMLDTRAGSGPKDDAAQVARQGVEAMLAGKGKVVAGSVKNRVQTASGKLLPEGVRARVHQLMTRPGSGS